MTDHDSGDRLPDDLTAQERRLLDLADQGATVGMRIDPAASLARAKARIVRERLAQQVPAWTDLAHATPKTAVASQSAPPLAARPHESKKVRQPAYRTWAGFTKHTAATVMAAILAVAIGYGLPAVARALPPVRVVDSQRPYEVGAGVTVIPPSGAMLDVTGTRPAQDGGSALFRLGPVQYAIMVQPFDGDLAAAAARLRARITDTSGYQVAGDQLAVATPSGLSGLQGGYIGPGRAGRYAVFVADGYTIEVTVSGDDLDVGRTLPAIEASTRTLKIRRYRG